jgi:hypothetical protein
MRDEQLSLVWRPVGGTAGESGRYELLRPASMQSTDVKVMDVYTPRIRPPRGVGRGDLRSVHILRGTADAPKLEELVDRYDAVFWSESSVEKFVLGYYLPLKSRRDWEILYQLYMRDDLPAPIIYGIAHEYPSVIQPLKDTDSAHVILEDRVMSVSAYLALYQHLIFE